jgi:TonB family protein
LRIEIKTGRVTRVTIAKSTGNAMLDDATVSALKYWRFEPNKLQPIRELLPGVNDSRRDQDSLAKVPVSFVMGLRPTRRTLP